MSDRHTAVWRKSTRSNAGGNCVEVAQRPEAVGVRGSKDAQGPVLVFAPDSWQAFVAAVRQGEFDR